MQCWEMEIMLVHLHIELQGRLSSAYLDRHLLCEVLEQLDVNNYEELRGMESPVILECARLYPGLFVEAA